MKYFCSKCGKNLETVPSNTNFMCGECFLSSSKKIQFENEYFINICPDCNAFLFNQLPDQPRWVLNTETDPLKIVIKAVTTQLIEPALRKEPLNITLNLDLDSYEKCNHNFVNCQIISTDKLNSSINSTVKIKIKNRICINCAKQHGKRFECVIQLRGSIIYTGNLDLILSKIQDFVENNRKSYPDQFISEILPKENGYDLNLSSKSLMRKIIKNLSQTNVFIMKSSKKLVGVNNDTGAELNRTYILIRLLDIKTNMLISYNNKVYEIKHVSDHDVRLWDVEGKILITKKLEIFEDKSTRLIDDA